LNNQIPKEGMKFLVEKLQNRSPAISIITQLELLSWPRLTLDDIKTIEKFLDLSEIFPFNQEVVWRAAEIRRFRKIS
jgi:predicted nucleic acid-binding protein